MKPIFGDNVLTDEIDDDCVADEEFLVQEISEKDNEQLCDAYERLEEATKGAKLPTALWAAQSICVAFLGIYAIIFLKVTLDSGLAAFYRQTGPLTFIALAIAVVFILLCVAARAKRAQARESGELERREAEYNAIHDRVMKGYSIPADADKVDLVEVEYTTENGEVKLQTDKRDGALYMNSQYFAFGDSDNIYFADVDGKYRFARANLRAIRKIKGKVGVYSWFKEQSIRDEAYAAYSLKKDDTGSVYAKYMYRLELCCDGEDRCLYFMPYDLPAFEKLTGLTAEE